MIATETSVRNVTIRRVAEQALDACLDNTALFCAADSLAPGGLSCLARHVRCPEEIGVAGFDSSAWSRSVIPALTAIDFDFHELSHVRVRRIEEEDGEDDFDRRPVPPRLERRDSTGPVRKRTESNSETLNTITKGTENRFA